MTQLANIETARPGEVSLHLQYYPLTSDEYIPRPRLTLAQQVELYPDDPWVRFRLWCGERAIAAREHVVRRAIDSAAAYFRQIADDFRETQTMLFAALDQDRGQQIDRDPTDAQYTNFDQERGIND